MSRLRADTNSGVRFTRESAAEIAALVRAARNGDRKTPGIRLPHMASSGVLHLCKTTSEFTKGTTSKLNVWEGGDPPNETQSADRTIENVVNKYATIAANKFVSVARHGNGYWYVIAAECS